MSSKTTDPTCLQNRELFFSQCAISSALATAFRPEIVGNFGLVTGGAGFIGSHIVERLVRDGHRVQVIDSLITAKRENVTPLLSITINVAHAHAQPER